MKRSGKRSINGGRGPSLPLLTSDFVKNRPSKCFWTFFDVIYSTRALIRLRTNKLLAGIISYGAEDASNAITQLTVHREGAHGDYFPVGTFDLDPRASMSRLCFDAPFATKSLIIEVVRFDGQLVFNFNLLVVS